MTIRKKIELLTQFANRRALSRAAGLHPNTITNILRSNGNIATSTTVRLARVMKVDIGWFADDSQEWPPIYVDARNLSASTKKTKSNFNPPSGGYSFPPPLATRRSAGSL